MARLNILPIVSGVLFLNVVFQTESIQIPQKQNPEPLKWWQEGLIYQIYPRSHQDSNGDGIGDLAGKAKPIAPLEFNFTSNCFQFTGIESRLDYFVEIGISAVWISPIYKSPMKDFGYDISNFTDIDPLFGNLDAFKSLSNAMKDRGTFQYCN